MKKNTIFLLFLVILGYSLLGSCSPGGSTSNTVNCSAGKEVCISVDKVQPFTMSQPMILNINISSTKDFSALHVTLDTFSGVIVDGPQTWENYLSSSASEPGLATWDFAIKAGQTLTFKRVLRFPPDEGYYWIVTEVINREQNIDASESFTVLLESKGVQVIRNGTPLPPHTPNVTSPVYGPGTPIPTYSPNLATVNATLASKFVTPSQFVPLVATSTPLSSPYPPPSSSRTPTPVSSPYP